MRVDIITLFPEFFVQLKSHSIVGRAIRSGKVELGVHNLRDYSSDNYKTVDDHPYGGGAGMVLKVDVMARAIAGVRDLNKGKVILLTPQGRVYKQAVARELSRERGIVLVCGHYEGFDERIRSLVDLELSIGDYVLTGGEIPAMTVVDSVVRLLPGVLGDDDSSKEESFEQGLLEYPHYTRPEEFEGVRVPQVLLSGNHQEISKWRAQMAKERTRLRRPDLVRE